MTPAKTQALAAGQLEVLATSTTTYGGAGCAKYVVDTTVTSASTPPSGYYPDFTFAYEPGGGIGTPDKTICESTVVTVELYRKLAGETAFNKVGGGTIKGAWSQGAMFPCTMSPQSGFASPAAKYALPAAGKTDTYRVAISNTVGGATRVVKAGLSHVPQPPK